MKKIKKSVTKPPIDLVEDVLFAQAPRTAYSDNVSCPVSAASTLRVNSLGAASEGAAKREKARLRQVKHRENAKAKTAKAIKKATKTLKVPREENALVGALPQLSMKRGSAIVCCPNCRTTFHLGTV